jgi:hypothetical protein
MEGRRLAPQSAIRNPQSRRPAVGRSDVVRPKCVEKIGSVPTIATCTNYYMYYNIDVNRIHRKILTQHKFFCTVWIMAKPGRPKKRETERKTSKLQVCFTPAERQVIETAAQSDRKDVSTWVRDVSLRAAQEKG